MKRTMRRTLGLALLMMVAPARADFQSLASPGPLSAAHAGLNEQCDKCHVPFKGIPNGACLACHTALQKHIDAGRGPHARFAAEGKKCASCHADHKGEKRALSPPVATSGFDHLAQTGVALDGKHAGVACASCHKAGKHGPRWIDLPSLIECKSCHKDPHRGGLGSECAACHATRGFAPATKSIADHSVPMSGGHTGLKCEQCHKGGAHLVMAASCGDCHEQKHGGTKAPCKTCHNVNDWKSATFKHDFCSCILPGKHQTASCLACHPAFRFVPTPLACAGCHEKERKHEELGACARCHSALSWKTRAFDHNQPRVGFALAGKHLEVGCENCHTQKGVFRGAPKACAGCHVVPAHGDFGGCAQCHTVAGFARPTFSHDKTRFPLDGHHAEVRCEICHARFQKGAFAPGPNACVSCHSDPHGGQFGEPTHASRSPSLRLLLAQAGSAVPAPHTFSPRFGCIDCHTTRGWKPSTVDVAKHATFAYVLRGEHERVPCARCHSDGKFVGTAQKCASCHIDRHRGRFGDGCERCHDESSWRHHPSFEHARATGFQLEGAHDGLACAQCHGKDRQRLARVPKVGCATCHTPRHGDQFGADCARCHKPTRFSDVPPFDHARTLFPLDRRHAAVRCTTCHDAARVPRLDPDCRTCHGDPHRGRTLLDCGECHRADVWRLVRFDHDRTEFPLRGRHFVTPCRDCHTNDQYTGVRSECVACHRGDRQRADSLHVDHRSFGFDCSECHRAFNW
jgi:hypothetical protein